jgi:hypothetical protein
MVIYLDQHRAHNAIPVSGWENGTYGDEIMNSNWNPAVVYLSSDVAQHAISPELPDDAPAVDVDAFLDKVYALATQI